MCVYIYVYGARVYKAQKGVGVGRDEESRLVANRWVGAQVEQGRERCVYIAQGQEAKMFAVILG